MADFVKGQMVLYGSIVGSPPRRVGGTARTALVVSAAASLAVVGVILVASSSMSTSSNVLMVGLPWLPDLQDRILAVDQRE